VLQDKSRDACSLVSKEEIESVQAAPVNDVKNSEHSDEFLLFGQLRTAL